MSESWSLFEFIIRDIGGLLSAGELTGDQLFIDTAVSLGRAVLPIIEGSGRFFNSAFSISTHNANNFVAEGCSGRWTLAGVGTFQLEFLTLARLTNAGLISRSIGAGHDSYYEYIIKSYVMTGGTSAPMLERYLSSVRDVKAKLLFRTIPRNLTGIGEVGDPMMEHLATFAAGMLAVGCVRGNPRGGEDLALAAQLARTYATVYRDSPAGVMPERVRYNTDRPHDLEDFAIVASDYLLRPETVESIYVLWKFTGLKMYRDYAWEIFLAINRSCRVPGGFAAVSAQRGKVQRLDQMESFFMAETLKYLYLTFADSEMLSPGEWVFNTEAHPLIVWNRSSIRKFGHLVKLDQLGTMMPPEKGFR
jgi:mannosyl-oligosaccharide alpha-1,2-mannosidase